MYSYIRLFLTLLLNDRTETIDYRIMPCTAYQGSFWPQTNSCCVQGELSNQPDQDAMLARIWWPGHWMPEINRGSHSTVISVNLSIANKQSIRLQACGLLALWQLHWHSASFISSFYRFSNKPLLPQPDQSTPKTFLHRRLLKEAMETRTAVNRRPQTNQRWWYIR